MNESMNDSVLVGGTDEFRRRAAIFARPAVCRVLIMSTERPQITHSRRQTDRFESPHYCTRESRRHSAKRSGAKRKLLDEIHYLFIYLFQAAGPIYRTVKQ